MKKMVQVFTIVFAVVLTGVVHGMAEKLLIASRQGDVGEVRRLLAAEVGAHTLPGALLAAAREGHDDIMRILLDEDARHDGYAIRQWGGVLLYSAVQRGHRGIVRILLAEGVNPNVTERLENASLVMAVRSGNLGIVQELLQAGASPNIYDETGMLLLRMAVEMERPDSRIVHALLQAGANLNAADMGVLTLLGRAAQNGNPEVARVLINWGADANAVDRYGLTPLVRAVYGGDSEVAQLLLDVGADPTVVANRGKELLLFVRDYGSPQMKEVFENAIARQGYGHSFYGEQAWQPVYW